MIYATLTELAGPLLRRHLTRRAGRGKEEAARLPERYGEATRPRPEGKLVWFHAASIGEGVALLGLIGRLLDRFPNTHVMVTSGTVTSAQMLARRLPDRAFHQYVPLDRPSWVRRFLDHWQPDMAVWTESEIWPNLLTEIARRNIPAAMVNARLSVKSARSWGFYRLGLARLLSGFSVRLAQSEADAQRLSGFGVPFTSIGNLKLAVEPAPVDAAAVKALVKGIAGRPFWLAAGTHQGEETIVLTAHRTLAHQHPGLLTIIVPRHPARGDEIAVLAESEGLCLDRRSTGALPDKQTDIYLADTLGELGTFYAATPIAFIGGSFAHGGHSAVEAAQADVAIVYGPDMRNNQAIATALEQAGGATRIENADQLAAIVDVWLTQPSEAERSATAAKVLVGQGKAIFERVVEALQPLFDTAGLK